LTRLLQFLAVVLVALALAPVGAHLLARPNKIGLPQDEYFTTQAAYLGWAVPTGIVLIGAIVVTLVLTIVMRGRGRAFWLALTGFVLIAATLVIFFIWTFPANQATNNWTIAPENWQTLRTQWEYSHSANGVITFLALCAVASSVLVDQRSGERDPADLVQRG
jgi:hypothetical protein